MSDFRPRKRVTRIRETTPVSYRTAHAFVRRFVKEAKPEDLEMVPRRFGMSCTFLWGDDRVIKVPKNAQRHALLKETALCEHLLALDLPIVVPRPLSVHPRGLYATYERIHGAELDPEAWKTADASAVEGLGSALGRFLTVLHTTDFPSDVLSLVPVDPTTAADLHGRLHRRIAFINRHAPNHDTSAWERRLSDLAGPLHDVRAVAHCDFAPNHIFTLDSRADRFAVIDFGDASLTDIAEDFFGFTDDLASEGVDTRLLTDALLRHYDGDKRDLIERMALHRLAREIQRVFRPLRRQAMKSAGKSAR